MVFQDLIVLIEIMATFYLTCQSSNFYDNIRKIYVFLKGSRPCPVISTSLN